ncbi:MAG: thiamine phosphate synthase [Verrucomicrobia bacterium]|nr:MAG: thiamine phosphate synthase [Verrucomicrobiota bacterium]
MKPLSKCFLYGILDLGYIAPEDCLQIAEAMIEGGVDILQLRAKGHPTSTIKSLATSLASSLGDIPLIINDHPELVAETGAAGFHVGQSDLPLNSARALTDRTILAGNSTHTITQAQAAYAQGADYIGFGPLFATPTKPGRLPIGLENIRAVHRLVPIPIFCIGGIKRENLAAILEAGARRVVIVSGILQAADVRTYCHDCKDILKHFSILTQSGTA